MERGEPPRRVFRLSLAFQRQRRAVSAENRDRVASNAMQAKRQPAVRQPGAVEDEGHDGTGLPGENRRPWSEMPSNSNTEAYVVIASNEDNNSYQCQAGSRQPAGRQPGAADEKHDGTGSAPLTLSVTSQILGYITLASTVAASAPPVCAV